MIFVVYQNLLHLNVYHLKVNNLVLFFYQLFNEFVFFFFIYLGNPLAFTSAYEQIILSQTQSSTTKQDPRQPMNIVNKSNLDFVF
jgi:hypothetical protein